MGIFRTAHREVLPQSAFYFIADSPLGTQALLQTTQASCVHTIPPPPRNSSPAYPPPHSLGSHSHLGLRQLLAHKAHAVLGAVHAVSELQQVQQQKRSRAGPANCSVPMRIWACPSGPELWITSGQAHKHTHLQQVIAQHVVHVFELQNALPCRVNVDARHADLSATRVHNRHETWARQGRQDDSQRGEAVSDTPSR